MTDIRDILRKSSDIRSSASGTTGSTDVDGAIAELSSEKLSIDGSMAMTGALNMGGQAITTVGNVDGRDISADGSKLDDVEANAKDDQTGAEIKFAYESQLDTNVFDDNAVSKLADIEADAKDDQSAAEVSVTSSGNLESTNVQSALVELQNDIDGINGTQPWVIKSINTTVSVGDRVLADVSVGVITITLPITGYR